MISRKAEKQCRREDAEAEKHDRPHHDPDGGAEALRIPRRKLICQTCKHWPDQKVRQQIDEGGGHKQDVKKAGICVRHLTIDRVLRRGEDVEVEEYAEKQEARAAEKCSGMRPGELCIELSLRAGTQHADREDPGAEELHEIGEQDARKQTATQEEAAEQGHDREARTEGERLAAAVQQVLALQLRLIDICIAVDDLIQGEQQEDERLMQAVLSCAELDAEKEETSEDREQ